MTILVFSLVFGKFVQVPSDGLPYPVFAYTALLPWQLFATATTKSADSLVNNIHLVSKIYFPRMIVPVAAVFVSLADFGFSFGILLLMMVCYGIFPNWAVITLPFYLLLAVATALGVGLWLASLSVKFRDVQIAVTYLIQLWFYATPVIYPTSLVPQQWQFFYRLNPMTQVIEGFRWGLLGTGQLPDVTLIISLLLVVGLVLSGAFYFRQTEGSIADSL
jgi:lipopolysaccharide transport system permease protein